MKKVIAVIALALSVAGCVTQPQQQGPSKQMVNYFWQGHKERLESATASGAKIAPVYMESYEILKSLPDSYDKPIYLKGFATVARYAAAFDKGEISKDEFKIRSMEIDAETRQQAEELKRANEQDRQRRIQQSNIDTANTLRLMNALQPQAPSMPFPQRQQCDTRYVYGTYRTQCY